jgi:predicted acetylornithine/succinylornithine family transaminase
MHATSADLTPLAATASTSELFDGYVLRNYGRFPVALARGRGARVWDEEGREYLDFCTGIAVCSLGHCHPKLIAAIQTQSANLIHVSNLYYNRQQAEAARRLVDVVRSPGRVFFCNSGAEANEAAFKLARKFGHESRPAGYFATCAPEILTFTNSFHGRTMAGIAATAQEKVKTGFYPMAAGFRHLPFNDIPALEASLTPHTVAIMLEPVQGEGGVHIATADFLRAAREICDRHNLLMILDEVQCGLGRCGDLCGWRAVGAGDVTPDIVTWAKGLGGGFPIGAVWIGTRLVQKIDSGACDELHTLLGPGSHGTTYGGSPLGSAVVNAVLDAIEEEDLCNNARVRGAQALTEIHAMRSDFIKCTRGCGLLIGIELNEAAFTPLMASCPPSMTPAVFLANRLIDDGLLVPPAGPDVIRWLPPLTVTQAEIHEGAQKLRSALDSLKSQAP